MACLPSLTCPDRGSDSFVAVVGGAAAVVVVKLFISSPHTLSLSFYILPDISFGFFIYNLILKKVSIPFYLLSGQKQVFSWRTQGRIPLQ